MQGCPKRKLRAFRFLKPWRGSATSGLSADSLIPRAAWKARRVSLTLFSRTVRRWSPVLGCPDSHSDGPSGKLAPQGVLRGLTRTLIDRRVPPRTCRPPRNALRRGCASPLPVTREGPDRSVHMTVLSMHSAGVEPVEPATRRAQTCPRQAIPRAVLSAAWTRTRTCTWSPSLTTMTTSLEPAVLLPPDKAVARCPLGWAVWASFDAWGSNPPTAAARAPSLPPSPSDRGSRDNRA